MTNNIALCQLLQLTQFPSDGVHYVQLHLLENLTDFSADFSLQVQALGGGESNEKFRLLVWLNGGGGICIASTQLRQAVLLLQCFSNDVCICHYLEDKIYISQL